MLDEEDKLAEHFDAVVKSIESIDFKKYNLHTVKNFITHFDLLDTDAKPLVFNGLIEYLSIIRSTPLPDSNRITIELYINYLSQIAVFYTRLGFITNLTYRSYTLLILLIFPVLFIVKSSYFIYIFLSIILISHKIRVELKKRQRRVFGPGY